MRFDDILLTAFRQIRANKLRSFFTLLGIIVSVAFLVAVVAIIQGMNAYVKENIADNVVGTNTFQVRRMPARVGLFDEDDWRVVLRRPKITEQDAAVVRQAVPEATAIALTSGYPTPQADVVWGNRTLGDVLIFGITPDYQVVQDYRFAGGQPLSDVDVRERRFVCVIGSDVAEKLFESVDPVGREIRIRGERFTIVGVVGRKGKILGQSFDGFVMLPFTTFESMYGRRQTTTISVKLPDASLVGDAMGRAQEAMRLEHRLAPNDADNFSIETSDALISFWKSLTSVLFSVVPAVVGIGIVVGGIVIMNIMLMSVRERTHEIGLRKSVGATQRDIRRQFLAEAVMLATLGGASGSVAGWTIATMIAAASPLPARVTSWSVAMALTLGAGVGVLFGVYPATRAARLDPVAALRAE
ncbi:MAG: ABC transporter permease [Gemmatimonadaceae bacterium]